MNEFMYFNMINKVKHSHIVAKEDIALGFQTLFAADLSKCVSKMSGKCLPSDFLTYSRL